MSATAPADADRLLDADEVAAMLRMGKDWLYAEVRAGRIPHVRLGRYVRFRKGAIDEWLREQEADNQTKVTRRR